MSAEASTAPEALRHAPAPPVATRGTGWPAPLRALASLRLTCVLLLILLYLTWQGTLAQVDLGLLEAQRKYFDSFVYFEEVGPLRLPLPGAHLVLWVFAVNLILGGLVRIRKRWSVAGVLVTHVGMVMMLAAGLARFHFADDGFIRLHEGQVASSYQSWHDWELVVQRAHGAGEVKEYVVSQEHFVDLAPADSRRFLHPELPFSLTLSGFLRNAMPVEAARAPGQRVIDGFALGRRPLEKEAERNFAGAYLDVEATDGTRRAAILWGWDKAGPYVFEAGGESFAVSLRKKRFPLGFLLRLDEFEKRDHPGTENARDYRSRVTRLEQGRERSVEIRMNEPMRHAGKIFYQSQWAPPDAESGGRFYSVFAVSNNPSDQWPLWSWLVMTLGMTLHFGRKLLLFALAVGARVRRTA